MIDFLLWYLGLGCTLFINTWLIYIIVMTAKKNEAKINKVLFKSLYVLGGIGFVMDILFRVMYGSWVTLPKFKKGMGASDLTFTHQLKEILRLNTGIKKDTPSYKVALFICKYMLEPFDKDHCNLEEILSNQAENKS